MVGPYRLIQPLSRGGMGQAWLAQLAGPMAFQKFLVVKLILPHLSSDKTFIHMFLREARLAALLYHPNIVQVFELGHTDDRYYLVMEYVPGVDLFQLLRAASKEFDDSPTPLGLCAYIISQVARGLEHAHRSIIVDGYPCVIVHRDVSPANVMVADDGSVKLLDFGIAKALSQLDSFTVTRGDARKGKQGYLAPELGTGVPVDARCDIYSCGVVLWELLTCTPFATVLTEGKLYAPPSEYRAGLPAVFDQICERALAQNPADRFQTAAEFASALEPHTRVPEGQPAFVQAWMRRLVPHKNLTIEIDMPLTSAATPSDELGRPRMPFEVSTGRPARRRPYILLGIGIATLLAALATGLLRQRALHERDAIVPPPQTSHVTSAPVEPTPTLPPPTTIEPSPRSEDETPHRSKHQDGPPKRVAKTKPKPSQPPPSTLHGHMPVNPF
jgi:serine/threonine protein kinase